MDPNDTVKFQAPPAQPADAAANAKQLLGSLQIKKQTGLADPQLSHAVKHHEKTKVPKIHKTTDDANRYTVYVPFDATTLSLGQAAPQWIDDRGMTAITDHHVHLSVVGKDEDPRTIVTLGGPVSSFPIEQFDLEGSQFPITAQHGYMMVTLGDAVHDALYSHHILSREKDILIRTSAPAGDDAATSQLQIQSDNGAVTIQGGGPTTVSTANNLTLSAWSNASIPDFFNTKEAGFWVEKAASYTALALITLKGMKDLVSGWRTVMVRPSSKLPIWLPKPCLDTIANAIASALTVATITQSSIDWAAAAGSDGTGEMAAGNAAITAEKNITMSAGISNTIYGNLGSYLVGDGSADVLGLLSSSLTGIGVATITGGISATMTALGDAKVTSELATATVAGERGVDVTSEAGGVSVQGLTNVNMAAILGPAAVYGFTRASLASGGTRGYGVVATPTGLTIGAVAAANSLTASAADPTCSLAFSVSAVSLTLGPSSVKLGLSKLDIAGPQIGMSAAGPVKVNGAAILLG